MASPEYVSDKTIEVTNCLKDIALSSEMDIGVAMCAEDNGDCMWYVLLNDIMDVSVLLCSPYGVFAQDTIGLTELDDYNYSVISHQAEYINDMKKRGFRGLSDNELEDWINGEF